jgi:hypothetical protein
MVGRVAGPLTGLKFRVAHPWRVARPLVLSHVAAPANHTIFTRQLYVMMQVFGCPSIRTKALSRRKIPVQ